jgi:hypothetical protein
VAASTADALKVNDPPGARCTAGRGFRTTVGGASEAPAEPAPATRVTVTRLSITTDTAVNLKAFIDRIPLLGLGPYSDSIPNLLRRQVFGSVERGPARTVGVDDDDLVSFRMAHLLESVVPKAGSGPTMTHADRRGPSCSTTFGPLSVSG